MKYTITITMIRFLTVGCVPLKESFTDGQHKLNGRDNLILRILWKFIEFKNICRQNCMIDSSISLPFACNYLFTLFKVLKSLTMIKNCIPSDITYLVVLYNHHLYVSCQVIPSQRYAAKMESVYSVTVLLSMFKCTNSTKTTTLIYMAYNIK